MQSKLMELVTGKQVASWLIIAFLVGYFIYKEWPEVHRRISSKAIKDHSSEQEVKTVEARLEAIETDIKDIKAKLLRDYDRINDVERQQRKSQRLVEESLEEREIIMEALLGALGGLRELGTNGPTHTAEAKIREYLNKQAHKTED